jgi:hypothetical protein
MFLLNISFTHHVSVENMTVFQFWIQPSQRSDKDKNTVMFIVGATRDSLLGESEK